MWDDIAQLLLTSSAQKKDTRSSQRHISGSEKMHQRANWTLKIGP